MIDIFPCFLKSDAKVYTCHTLEDHVPCMLITYVDHRVK